MRWVTGRFTPWEEPQRGLVGTKSRAGRFGEIKNFFLLLGFELRTAQDLAVVTILGIPAGSRTVGFLNTYQQRCHLIELACGKGRTESDLTCG